MTTSSLILKLSIIGSIDEIEEAKDYILLVSLPFPRCLPPRLCIFVYRAVYFVISAFKSLFIFRIVSTAKFTCALVCTLLILRFSFFGALTHALFSLACFISLISRISQLEHENLWSTLFSSHRQRQFVDDRNLIKNPTHLAMIFTF